MNKLINIFLFLMVYTMMSTVSAANIVGKWQCKVVKNNHSTQTQFNIEFYPDGSSYTSVILKDDSMTLSSRFKGTWELKDNKLLQNEQMLMPYAPDLDEQSSAPEAIVMERVIKSFENNKMILDDKGTRIICVRQS